MTEKSSKTYYNISVRLISRDYINHDLLPAKKGFRNRINRSLDRVRNAVEKDIYDVWKFFFGEYVPPVLVPFNYKDEANDLAVKVWRSEMINQEEVLQQLLKANESFPGIKFIVSSIDFDFVNDEEQWMINYPTQLYELAQLKHKYKEQIVPFVCVDPRRYQGVELRDFVLKYINLGFGGICMYPHLGFHPLIPAMKELLDFADKCRIPVIIQDKVTGLLDMRKKELGGDWHGLYKEYIDSISNEYPNLKICSRNTDGEFYLIGKELKNSLHGQLFSTDFYYNSIHDNSLDQEKQHIMNLRRERFEDYADNLQAFLEINRKEIEKLTEELDD